MYVTTYYYIIYTSVWGGVPQVRRAPEDARTAAPPLTIAHGGGALLAAPDVRATGIDLPRYWRTAVIGASEATLNLLPSNASIIRAMPKWDTHGLKTASDLGSL